ncbi:MAG: hypothetical protein AUJ72_03250 [Candidatus Omnitrophica bacterium CG1_02_46_14]|nr:MAG: hypothetical protein AUJ72_03250 [Candidatus Omnitrophica bacterium CG1_02_46_14]
MTNSKNHFDVVIIGGGGAGILAAISAARENARVLILEKMPKLGKKVLISGNGRCNITNDRLDAACYNPEAKIIVESIFSRFGRLDILKFFKELGLRVVSDKEGRVFPITNQSTSVMDLLELELSRLGVEIRCHSEVTGIKKISNGFTIDSKSDSVSAGHPILCAGGKAYPISGTDGSAYALAMSFGHTLIDPVPSTVPLLVDDPWCKHLTGQKITAAVRYEIDDEAGPAVKGDLLFTDYGLSGTAILDSSEELSIAIHRLHSKKTFVVVDLLPFVSEDELKKEIASRLRRKYPSNKLLAGLLPQKFAFVLADILKTGNPGAIAAFIKKKRFAVSGAKGWNEAEFTAGGINLHEVNFKTLESKKCPGLYLAGEILDVNGKRGGFNLAWAWASGFVAGLEAAKH